MTDDLGVKTFYQHIHENGDEKNTQTLSLYFLYKSICHLSPVTFLLSNFENLDDRWVTDKADQILNGGMA